MDFANAPLCAHEPEVHVSVVKEQTNIWVTSSERNVLHSEPRLFIRGDPPNIPGK